ncbi:MAG: hypothetical protein JSW38_05455 [Dehalococcoidia bacterium]|nr:MAG: hypothetical protein JSV02_09875 [Dehalococcoidia bacterium]UCG84257.1 MAG: hypothetical protein JSW38_05455 [Dehalococcoidia bacterium]
MAKVATKLFREPKEATIALDELKSKGFKADEIVVVASAERSKDLGADIKPVGDVAKLAGMGVSEATVSYYDYIISSGGIVVGVQADESRIAQAQEVLRGVTPCTCDDKTCDSSPGFMAASRMTATNPMDASMSGEFRRY